MAVMEERLNVKNQIADRRCFGNQKGIMNKLFHNIAEVFVPAHPGRVDTIKKMLTYQHLAAILKTAEVANKGAGAE